MSDQQMPARENEATDVSPFDELIGGQQQAAEGTSFTTAFRGYDRDEVDAAIARLTARLRADGNKIAFLEKRFRRVSDTANTTSREEMERVEAVHDAQVAAADARAREAADRLKAELTAANARAAAAEARIEEEAAAAEERSRENVERLESELAAANAQLAQAEQRTQALTEELVEGSAETQSRPQFEEILRVAEEQASLVIRNASIQGDRLLEAAREEIVNRRKDLQVEAESILSQAQHEAQQVRLRIDTELTAHQARLEREGGHAAEKVSQAEQEAAAIRTEAEKGAAALRSMVARETALSRSEAEEAVRELRVRALEFEESLTRRQDDAQQEFLMLHNQAVAHAERITQDANEQVAASLEHAQRLGVKADDFDRLMRAQAQQIEADANMRSREQLERARARAEKIIEMVTTHSQAVLRDAEDRTRQLRWQQHQLTSFMAEVKELIRPEGPLEASESVVSFEDEAPVEDVALETPEALLEDEAPVEHAINAEDIDAAHEEHEEAAEPAGS